MSFRKRNVGLASPSSNPGISGSTSSQATPSSAQATAQFPGVRPSPLDGRPTTSTGTQTLDDLLAGHVGFPLGNSILIEESGTTDFAGALLRFYAAEGVVQGHQVHVVGMGEQWGRELPGVIEAASFGGEKESRIAVDKEKMKIAWRYEKLGDFGATSSKRGGIPPNPLLVIYVHSSMCCSSFKYVQLHDPFPLLTAIAPPIPNRSLKAASFDQPESAPALFCHAFDLTKRLSLPTAPVINFIPLHPPDHATSSFPSILSKLTGHIKSCPPNTVHRLVFPTLLSPALYSPSASHPHQLLPFLHSLRSLLRQHPNTLTAILTLPLTLYPRSTGLTRWIELLSDGVLELSPFPHSIDAGPSTTTSGAATAQEEKPQGLVRVHRLPVAWEKGQGGGGDDLAFTVSRRKFVIKPFSLPPVEGDTEAQKGEGDGKPTKVDIEF